MSTAPWISPDEARSALKSGSGKGVRIAILDSGIDTSHEALAGVQLRDRLLIRQEDDETTVEEDELADPFGHGTAVAWLIHQIAPEAELGSFRILGTGGAEATARATILSTAVREAMDRGYDIINCSFGTPARPVLFRLFKPWLDEAWLSDVHVVTACNNADFSRAEWPAHFSSVLAVNMLKTEEPLGLWHRPDNLVEFFARGDGIRVPWVGGSWKEVTGSSYAAPHVSGMAARILSEVNGLSSPLLKAVLRVVADPFSHGLSSCNTHG